MWAIIQYDKKYLNILKEDLRKKTDKNLQFYIPKIILNFYKKQKIQKREINILNDYMFCYHENFSNQNFFSLIKFSKGLKNILDGHLTNQKEINEFIYHCKNSENDQGIISKNFYKIILNTEYKFLSGPFMNKIFKIIGFNKKKIEILMGNIKLNIKKNSTLFNPIN